MLYCEEFKKLHDLTVRCCNSCHEDVALGYEDFLDVEDAEGKTIALVCCVVHTEYENKMKEKKNAEDR